ncbi:hypothetical protein PtB15_15B422 [Puccinia triticina]|nr:hypothetical protein PtB15_15B422 [Puccinia triticina]
MGAIMKDTGRSSRFSKKSCQYKPPIHPRQIVEVACMIRLSLEVEPSRMCKSQMVGTSNGRAISPPTGNQIVGCYDEHKAPVPPWPVSYVGYVSS